MKKFLLSLTAMFVMLTAVAGSFTVTFKSTTGEDGTSAQTTLSALVAEGQGYFSGIGSGTDKVYQGKSGYGIKFSTSSVNGKLVLNLAENAQVKITSIVVNAAKWKATETGIGLAVSVNDVAADKQDLTDQFADYTYTFDGSVAKSITLAATKRIYVKSMTVNFDGDNISVDEPEPVQNTKVANIAALLEANKDIAAGKKSSVTYELSNPITAIYQNGTSLYVKDASGYLLVYGSVGKTYKNGDVIPAGIAGIYSNYAGLPEFEPEAATFKEATAGAAVEPIVTTVDDANTEGISAYIEMQGVTVTGMTSSKANFTIADAAGEATITGRNNFQIDAVNGENLTVRGFVVIYNGAYQVYPIEILTASGKEVVSAPTFSVAAGEVAAGTEVELRCSTEGAAIYYTLDGTEPTTTSTLYAAPIVINEDTTIKAIAVKEGMENSEVATAAYTIKVVAANVAFYDFNAPATLTPAYPADKEGEGLTADGTTGNMQAVVSGVNFIKGNVVVSATTGASTDAKIYYQSGGNIQLRVYAGATVTVKSLSAGNNITKVVYSLNNTNSIVLPEGQTGTLTVSSDKKTVTWTGDAAEVNVYLPKKNDVFDETTYTANQNVQFNTIEVTCASDLTEMPAGSVAELPILIATAEDLANAWTKTVQGQITYFKQTADIDMTGITEWHAFNGYDGRYNRAVNYDGDYHVISNFAPVYRAPVGAVPSNDYYSGSIFGVLQGSVKNLGVVNAKVNISTMEAGILGGFFGGTWLAGVASTLDNVYVQGTMVGENTLSGGMFATMGAAGSMSNCYAQVSVESKGKSAGLVAAVNELTLNNCYVSATVKGTETALVAGGTKVVANNVVAIGEGAATMAGTTLEGEITTAATATAEAIAEIQGWDAFNKGLYFNALPALNWQANATEDAGVDNVIADEAAENAPVEYYNLQGVKVMNPANGLYIKKQGNKATKVLVK